MSFIFFNSANSALFERNVFPIIGLILISASNELYSDFTKSDKPLNADKTITKAIVAMQTPVMAMYEITLIALCDFFEIKYRFAMKIGKFKGLLRKLFF